MRETIICHSDMRHDLLEHKRILVVKTLVGVGSWSVKPIQNVGPVDLFCHHDGKRQDDRDGDRRNWISWRRYSWYVHAL
jgi:hypothetical protein